MAHPIVAVDLGGTSLRAALFESDSPTPIEHTKVPTEADRGPDAVIQRIIEAIESVLPESTTDIRIGVGVPGPVDPFAGVILEAPNIPGWKDIHLQRSLQDHFKRPVRLGNDANVAALGEWRHGAGQGSRNLLYMTVSTGIGGGVIADGRLLLGKRGLAGEFGHLTVDPNGPMCGCGQRGHLEAVAAGPAIARQANERLDAGEESSLKAQRESGTTITAVEIGEAAHQGDALAVDVLRQAGEHIGGALASLLHAFNPEVIVLGGGVSLIGAPLFEPLSKALHEQAMDPAYLDGLSVKPAALGDDAGLVGAMVLALPD